MKVYLAFGLQKPIGVGAIFSAAIWLRDSRKWPLRHRQNEETVNSRTRYVPDYLFLSVS
jgi:hypothetical protein